MMPGRCRHSLRSGQVCLDLRYVGAQLGEFLDSMRIEISVSRLLYQLIDYVDEAAELLSVTVSGDDLPLSFRRAGVFLGNVDSVRE